MIQIFRKTLSLLISFVRAIPRLPFTLWSFWKNWVWRIVTFSLLLFFYVLLQTFSLFLRVPAQLFSRKTEAKKARVSRVSALLSRLSQRGPNTIDRISLIDLAFQNMAFKRTRSMITIGGMALGIGCIVFLVSLGYGVNKLVIDQVARLEEMMQTDIIPQPGSSVKITDESLSAFQNLPNVKKNFPVIAVVAKVMYQSSSTDVAVYGVTSEYLQQSAIKPSVGSVFTSNEIASISNDPLPEVAGVSTLDEPVSSSPTQEPEFGKTIHDVEYSIDPETWVRVRQEPSAQSKLLGYTQRVSNTEIGTNVWGDSYEDGEEWGEWVAAEVPLWEITDCDSETEANCIDNKYRAVVNEDGVQSSSEGFMAHLGLQLESLDTVEENEELNGDVLGISTVAGEESTVEEDETASKSEDGWIEIASESGAIAQTEKRIVAMPENSLKKAVVNQAMLNVLGIPTNEAIGKTFESSFVVVGDLLGEDKEQLESLPTPYEIVGVVPDEKVPYFYVPFVDLRALGITQFSQAKIVVDDKKNLQQVRQQVEAMGFSTRSVVDTVEQIDRLFATARTVLALLGMVALAVASLGMFNTLTVSLLERTKEVGLMKAMGMRSDEISELFLTESMVMGFMGGLLGIVFGWLAGKGLGLVLSVFSVWQGQGVINISYIPLPFIVLIFGLSLFVGIATGVYPARRATKISALNALRYE